MQVRCENCWSYPPQLRRSYCQDCENYSKFIPQPRKQGRPYLVRVSELRYGEVTVWADSEEEAKTAASGAEINFFDSEITDMTAEPDGQEITAQKSPEYFGEARWCDEDVENALECCNAEISDTAVREFRQNSCFAERITERG